MTASWGTANAVDVQELQARAVPRLGGFNPTLVRLELRRLLRNRRTMIFTFVMPVAFFLLFGLNAAYADQNAGHGNVAAYIMISMAVYGAMLATTSTGASVSIERSLGWSRQLRLTPLNPAAYVVVKLLVALVVGLCSIAAVYVAGVITHKAQMPFSLWVETGLIAWVGSLTFAAFGLFMGYVLPGENVMQILGPGLALLAFLGGLFVPLQHGSVMEAIAKFTPMYGLNQLVHAPLTGDAVQITWLVNVVTWLVVFAAGATWRLRQDTARV
jgi:ABC-2 type transport system permease protein